MLQPGTSSETSSLSSQAMVRCMGSVVSTSYSESRRTAPVKVLTGDTAPPQPTAAVTKRPASEKRPVLSAGNGTGVNNRRM